MVLYPLSPSKSPLACGYLRTVTSPRLCGGRLHAVYAVLRGSQPAEQQPQEEAGLALRPPYIKLRVGAPAYCLLPDGNSGCPEGREGEEEGGRRAGERRIDAAYAARGTQRGQTDHVRSPRLVGVTVRHAPPGLGQRLRRATPGPPAAPAAAAVGAVERLRDLQGEAKGAAPAEGGGGSGECRELGALLRWRRGRAAGSTGQPKPWCWGICIAGRLCVLLACAWVS